MDRVSRSDTRIVDRSGVTFRHQDSRLIRVSRSDTRIVEDRSVTFRHQDSKKNESWIMLIYSNLKNLSPKTSMVWRPESSWMCLGCGQWLGYLLLLSVEYGSRFYVIIWYILLSILSWPMIPTQYLCLVLISTCICFLVICGVQQTCQQLRLIRNSSQS